MTAQRDGEGAMTEHLCPPDDCDCELMADLAEELAFGHHFAGSGKAVTTCRDCGEPIQWIDGKPFDVAPASHYRNKVHVDAVRGRPRPRAVAATVPVVAFSAHTSKEDQEKLMALLAAQGLV